MIQKKNVLNTVPVICLGALLLGSAYGQLHTPMTPPPITALASDILPTTGNVRALAVVVDFADAKYDTDRRLSDEEISSYLFGTDNTEFYPCALCRYHGLLSRNTRPRIRALYGTPGLL